MKKQINRNLSFENFLDQQYGGRGTEKREAYEQEFEAFKLGVLIQEMRGKKQPDTGAACGLMWHN